MQKGVNVYTCGLDQWNIFWGPAESSDSDGIGRAGLSREGGVFAGKLRDIGRRLSATELFKSDRLASDAVSSGLSLFAPGHVGKLRTIVDVGANVATNSQQLVDFAVMGEAFARAILNLERPSIGLLNVGAEDVKGNEAVRGAAQILRSVDLPIEFCGFVEGDDIAEGTVDVVVTDGFTGNVALKTAEGIARMISHMLKQELLRTNKGKVASVLAKPAFQGLPGPAGTDTASDNYYCALPRRPVPDPFCLALDLPQYRSYGGAFPGKAAAIAEAGDAALAVGSRQLERIVSRNL